MSDSTSSIASSLRALNDEYRAITNNLANASTPGFKRSRTSFEQLLDAATVEAERTGKGSGGEIRSTQATDFTQGALTRTDNTLDAAIEGDAFFVLETPRGRLFTRTGKFRLNGEGQFVDPAGRLVAGESGPITVPSTVAAGAIQITRDGSVRAGGREIGKLALVRFERPERLEPAGNGCYRAPASAGRTDAENAFVHQGFVEASNVSVVEELVALITVTRMYEANLKSISVGDDRYDHLMRVATA